LSSWEDLGLTYSTFEMLMISEHIGAFNGDRPFFFRTVVDRKQVTTVPKNRTFPTDQRTLAVTGDPA
jgi:hypothetical protein